MNRTNSRSSSKMTDIQYKHCLKVTKKIMDFPIAESFLDPVNVEVFTDYLTKVKKPMQLKTVLEKLESHQYLTLNDWKTDMNLIWKNAKIYNLQDSLIYLLAEELQEKFRELFEAIPATKDEEWVFKMRKIQSKYQRILHSKPSNSQK